MDLSSYNIFYFLGIGGIGMSAIARFMHVSGKAVYGYDRTPGPQTEELQKLGIHIHFEDSVELIPDDCKENAQCLVIYTPAVPKSNKIFEYFTVNNYEIKKRSEVLGMISKEKNCIAVAGTHGKTSVSSIISHIFYTSPFKCNAFVGGILKNYSTNLLTDEKSDFIVVEADEYDRSFLQLSPNTAVITSVDADHLDIYQTHNNIIQSFLEFSSRIASGGNLILHHKIAEIIPGDQRIYTYTYALDDPNADFFAMNISVKNYLYSFDFVTPNAIIKDITLGIPGTHNLENCIAALTCAFINNVPEGAMKKATKTFLGIQRRFDVQILNEDFIYIDDYAHHPVEIATTLQSIKDLFGAKKMTVVFQPHLYSRTRDFADEFAISLDNADEIILLDIYPARELPIQGVDSSIILNKIKTQEKVLCNKNDVIDVLLNSKPELLITMGAGDIGLYVDKIKNMFLDKMN